MALILTIYRIDKLPTQRHVTALMIELNDDRFEMDGWILLHAYEQIHILMTEVNDDRQATLLRV